MKQVYIVYIDGKLYGAASTWRNAYIMTTRLMVLKGFQATEFLHTETADFFTCQKEGNSETIEIAIEEQDVDAFPRS